MVAVRTGRQRDDVAARAHDYSFPVITIYPTRLSWLKEKISLTMVPLRNNPDDIATKVHDHQACPVAPHKVAGILLVERQ